MPKATSQKVVAFRSPAFSEPAPTAPFERRVAFRQLEISPLNSRRPTDVVDGQDQELEASILKQGLLQNLNARPTTAGRFEVFAGGRRLRAIARLVESGRYDPEAELIPLKVHPGISDADLILVSLAENHHRRDAHFLEEAAAVANAVRILAGEDGPQRGDGVTAKIAEQMGCGQRWVQILWQLDTGLHPELKAYFLAHPDLSIELAKTCRSFPHENQLPALALLKRGDENGWTPSAAELRSFLARDLPEVAFAIFDPARASGGVLEALNAPLTVPAAPADLTPGAAPSSDLAEEAVGQALNRALDGREETLRSLEVDSDLEEADPARFLDPAEFMRLQEEAVEEERQKLAAKYSFVEVLRVPHVGHAFMSYKRGDGPEAGALIIVTPKGEVRIETNMVPISLTPRALAGGPLGPSAPSEPKNPEEEILRQHYRNAARRKTEALQEAVAASLHTTMRVTIPALLGGSGVCKIQCSQLSPDDLVVAPVFEEAFDSLHEHLGELLEERKPGQYPHFNFPSYDGEHKVARAIEILARVPDTAVEKIFTGLVASRVGTYSGYTPGPGDAPDSLALARQLNVNVSRDEDLDSILQGYRKPHLRRVAAACGVEGPLDGTAADLRAAIIASPGAPSFFPVEYGFGSCKEIAAAIANLGTKKAQPKPEAKKGGKKKPAAK
jgi:hypothetical protein